MAKKQTKKEKKDKIFNKQVFLISAEPYKQDIIVVINGTFDDAYKKMKSFKTNTANLNIKEIDSNKEEYFMAEDISTNGYVITTLPFGFIVNIKVQDNWIDTVCLVAHECLHLTHYICRRAGIVLSKESEEAYTYLQADLIQKILSKIY